MKQSGYLFLGIIGYAIPMMGLIVFCSCESAGFVWAHFIMSGIFFLGFLSEKVSSVKFAFMGIVMAALLLGINMLGDFIDINFNTMCVVLGGLSIMLGLSFLIAWIVEKENEIEKMKKGVKNV